MWERIHVCNAMHKSGCATSLTACNQVSRQPFFCRRPFRVQQTRGPQLIRAAGSSISSNDFKPGTMLEIDGAPYRVMESLHVKPGKGAAFVRTKLKHQISGNSSDKTFRAGETVATADIAKQESQYTYADGNEYVFMNMETYEETRIPRDEAWAKYLKEGSTVALIVWNNKVISVDVPNHMELEVAETGPGVKGNTVSGGTKAATLETGAKIQVPLFILQGQKILVDTRTDSYLNRVKG